MENKVSKACNSPFIIKKAKTLFQAIKKANKIAIFLHRDPDADAVGSSLALFWWLKKIGKRPVVFSPQKVDRSFQFLPEFKKIKMFPSNFQQELFIFPDVANPSLIKKNFLLPQGLKIRIDHHLERSWADLELVDPKASSVGELLVDFFQLLRQKFDQRLSFCLLTAIVGDTLNFQTPSTTAKTLKTAAFLIEQKADIAKINNLLFNAFKFNQLKALAKILSQAELDRKRKLVWLKIFPQDWQQLFKSGRKAAFDFLVNHLKTLPEAERYFLLSQIGKSEFRVSLRSSDLKKDVRKWAMTLGGGGHQTASGAIFKAKNFPQALEKVFQAFDQSFNSDDKERKP